MEVCIDNIESGIEAQKGGAMRIELCSALSEGGLTPSVGFLKVLKKKLSIPIFVMIRPRGGNFIYSEDEVEIMERDIESLKENGADGFVFGLLTEQRTVDVENCARLLMKSGGLPCTFHRAFDNVSCPIESLELVIGLGFTRILTSGLQPTALEGSALIRQLMEASKDRIIIMPGAGINRDNVTELIQKTGAREFHGSAKIPKDSYSVTDGQAVKEMLTIYHSRIENQMEYSPKPKEFASSEENQ